MAAPETTEAFAGTTEEKEETETTQQEESEVSLEDSWKTIYLDRLETGPSRDPEAKYGLIYVNDDAIPELAIKSREKGDSYYTCGKEGVDELHIDPEDMNTEYYDPNAFAWMIEDVRKIRPFFVKGKLGFWECDHEIEYVEDISENEEKNEQIIEMIYKPLLFTGYEEEW